MTFELYDHLKLEKHRYEEENYSVDFREGGRLDDDETITGGAEVKVFSEAVGPDTDVSADFGISSVLILGDKVVWKMAEAATGKQDAGDYVLRVRCTTSAGRKPVSLHRFVVSETGDATAP